VSEVFIPAALPRAAPGADASGKTSLTAQMSFHMMEEHLTPQAAGKLASDAGVKMIVMTHIVAGRLKNPDEIITAGIKEQYNGKIVVGHDLTALDLFKAE
jgi:ribonuclease BN (tRNA processing enzyme)